MIVISWNTQGLHEPKKLKEVKALVKSVNLAILLIQESKMQVTKVEKYKKQFWLKSYFVANNATGQSGGLITLWDPSKVICSLESIQDAWLAVLVKCNATGSHFGLINIYGPQDLEKKAACWVQISEWLATHAETPYLIGGNFNAIRSLEEKKGGLRKLERSDDLLNNFIDSQQLLEPFCVQGRYTWSNRRPAENNILKKLDRFLHTYHWMENGITTQMDVLTQGGSDHWPISLHIDNTTKRKGSPFRFERMWISHPTFSKQVESWWKEEIGMNGSKMYKFAIKLRNLKDKLKSWNKGSFGDVFEKWGRLELELAQVEANLQMNQTEDLLKQEQVLLQ